MSYMQTILNGVKTYVKQAISNIKQPNWNQNDKNAQDYIKNRPFYTSDPIETMVVKEQTVSIADDGYGNYYAQLSAKIFFELDKTYIVNFNGEEYKCTPWEHPYSGGHYIGNGALYDGYEQFNGKEPFVIESYSGSQVHLGVNAEGTYTISVIEKYEDVVKIPEKYLPVLAGQNVTDKKFEINNEMVIAGKGAERFNDYAQNIASGEYSHAEGTNTVASGQYSHAEGYNTTASGWESHAEGGSTIASGSASHSEGYGTRASGSNSHAEGYNTIASSSYSHAEGYGTTASNNYSHAEGHNSSVSGYGSHAEGGNTIASGNYSHTEGYSTRVTTNSNDKPSTTSSDEKGRFGHAEGFGSVSYGTASHAEGNGTYAFGKNSHSEGYKTTAHGRYSHTEGSNTSALNESGHAEGSYTKADGTYSHAEGYNTTALRSAAHSEGYYTQASGNYSHAEGDQTVAIGSASHAEGEHTITSSAAVHAQGRYNIDDTNNVYQHIVGNGSSNTSRSNIHTLDWQGNAWFQGDVYVSSTSGTNKDEGSKKLATVNDINTAIASIPTPDISGQIKTHNTSADSHSDIRAEITSATLNLKNELLNGAGEAYDTLKELGDLIDENQDAIDALEIVATGKQNKITGTTGQVVGFDIDGNAVAQDFTPNVQSNWNQTDETALDYIKNKPFGREPNEIIVENLEVTTRPGASDYNNANGEAVSSISGITNAFNCEFELGCQYKVTYNDTDYYVEAINDGYGSIALGAYSYWELNEEVPFRLVNNYNSYYDTYNFYGEILGSLNGTCTFSIEKITENIKMIDDIFISDTIARTAYVDEKIAAITGDNFVLITVEDIDEICGANIVNINEVTY